MIEAGLIERFWPKVDVRGADECWPWLAATSNGYGVIGRPGFGTGNEYAHRVALTLAKGPAPAGSPFAIHSCDRRSCCNPRHLRWGSPRDNTQDAVRRDRLVPHNRAKTECPRGHPYDEANTQVSAGRRSCRTCKREATRRWRERRSP